MDALAFAEGERVGACLLQLGPHCIGLGLGDLGGEDLRPGAERGWLPKIWGRLGDMHPRPGRPDHFFSGRGGSRPRSAADGIARLNAVQAIRVRTCTTVTGL